jgi:peptidyl-prolyl cis-trans isomerase SurA
MEGRKCHSKPFLNNNVLLNMKKLQVLLISLILITFNSHAIENKIILKLDNDIITSLDIFNEINNLKFFNQSLVDIEDEEIYQIGLNSLINFKIKKKEVLSNFNQIEIKNEDYINSLIENNAKQLNFKNISDLEKALNERNISFEDYKDKLIINILWNQIIYSKYNQKIVINENELKKKINLQNDNKKTYNLSEIIFQIDNISDLEKKYEIIKKDINKLGFQNAALKYSVGKTSNEGGNLGWVDETLINKNILDEIKNMSYGSITNPIRIPSGFLILKVNDVKKIETDLDLNQELKKLINYEKEKQLNNYSSIYFNKIKKDIKINAP